MVVIALKKAHIFEYILSKKLNLLCGKSAIESDQCVFIGVCDLLGSSSGVWLKSSEVQGLDVSKFTA